MKFVENSFMSLFALLLVGIVITDAKPPKKVMAGTTVQPGELRYQVGLSLRGHVSCGGALISDRHVLTAAHCFVGKVDPPYTKGYVVLTGSTKRSVRGEEHPIQSVSVHPDYDDGGLVNMPRNDIAVVTLAKPVMTNEYQAPIALPSSDLTERVTGLVSGWGYETPGGYYPDELKKSFVTIITNEECDKLYFSRDTTICGYDGSGRGFCDGDSGGPLVYNNEVVGIVSAGISCGAGYPDFYTRVYAFKKFIEEAMQHP